MNPYTGEVLALANYPTYDPNERLKPGRSPSAAKIMQSLPRSSPVPSSR